MTRLAAWRSIRSTSASRQSSRRVQAIRPERSRGEDRAATIRSSGFPSSVSRLRVATAEMHRWVSLSVVIGGSWASPTPSPFHRRNPRFSAAFHVAGKSPKSPGSEKKGQERAVFGRCSARESASPSAKPAGNLRLTAAGHRRESVCAEWKWRPVCDEDENWCEKVPNPKYHYFSVR